MITTALEWRLSVEPGGAPGAQQMAIDEWLLGEADRTGNAFLRLYRWDPPCLSLGRNEPALLRYDRGEIERLGLAVVRRPTGGRAVWHEQEVTYAVAAPIDTFGSLRSSYRRIHERLVVALRRLGAPVEVAANHRPTTLDGTPGSCFTAPVGGEIMVNGKKVVGSAQVRLGHAFLQHGSILLDGSQDRVAVVSLQPSAVSSATSLATVLGRPVSFAEVSKAIVESWGDFSPEPLHLARAALPAFDHPSWTWRR